jgi:hypothetical protein
MVGREFYFLYSLKKIGGDILSPLCPSVHPSSYLRNLSSEIDVVDNKCSFRQGLVDQGLSRSYWKVEGHSAFKRKFQF